MAEFKADYVFNGEIGEWTSKIFEVHDGKAEHWPVTVRGASLRVVRSETLALLIKENVIRFDEYVEMNSLSEYLGH